jgi:hypothetical protein
MATVTTKHNVGDAVKIPGGATGKVESITIDAAGTHYNVEVDVKQVQRFAEAQLS